MKFASDQDHQNKQLVWNTMEKMNLVWYHDTYLKAHVLLLVVIFETF